MAKFIECSTKEIRYLRGEIVKNHAVNIDRCKHVRKSRFKWYPDNNGKPSLVFKGCDQEWVYDDEASRDTDYEKILSI